MDNDVKNNIKQTSIWMRGLYMLLFSIFYSVAEVVLFAVIIFQFLLKLITGETNQRLLKLGQSLAIYIYQIIQFLNFNSERKPYPFNAWPKAEPQAIKRAEQLESDTTETSSVIKAADNDKSDDKE